MENLSQDSWCPNRDSNQAFPECESTVLPLHQPTQCIINVNSYSVHTVLTGTFQNPENENIPAYHTDVKLGLSIKGTQTEGILRKSLREYLGLRKRK
jgi:hypothetical protein